MGKRSEPKPSTRRETLAEELERMARSLVSRGLASTLILESPWRLSRRHRGA